MSEWQNLSHVRWLMQNTRKCEVCGGTDSLIPHHKHPKSREESYEGDINGLENLVVVCGTCHSRYHDRMGATPSSSGIHAADVGRAFEELCHRWQNPAFTRMAPEYVLDAHCEWVFRRDDEDDQNQDANKPH